MKGIEEAVLGLWKRRGLEAEEVDDMAKDEEVRMRGFKCDFRRVSGREAAKGVERGDLSMSRGDESRKEEQERRVTIEAKETHQRGPRIGLFFCKTVTRQAAEKESAGRAS